MIVQIRKIDLFYIVPRKIKMSNYPNKKGNHAHKKKNYRKTKKAVDVRDTNRYQHWQAKAALLGAILTYVPQAKKDFEILTATMSSAEAGDLFIRQMTLASNAYLPFRQPELKPIAQNSNSATATLPFNQALSSPNSQEMSSGLKRSAPDL